MRRQGPGYLAQCGDLPRPLPLRCLDLWRGFDPREADWYRQLRGDTDGVFTNRDREWGLHGRNGHYAYVLDNKALFADAMAARGLPTPPLLASYIGGRWRVLSEAGLCGHVVVKPVLGSKGRGLSIVEGERLLREAPPQDSIATPVVVQAPYAAAINAGSLNTIRALMVRAPTGEAVLCAATHRFGTRASGAVDNFSAGGLVARIDRDTGTLGPGMTIGPRNRVLVMPAHPETGERIEGVVVPRWDEVRELLSDLGAAFPELHYVGWDIAVGADGPTVIEGNAHPSLRFFQLTDRLAQDPAVGPLLGRLMAPCT